jgi:asparagine synthase (glutamine-hydrolysing)
MCGLAGIATARGVPPPDRGRLERAVRALRHRGPDGEAVHLADGIAFAHTRLSIIDVARGSQPMANEDGSVLVVYNGEIWNHELLRTQLESAGHRFRTRADTEVLVHGYEEWGEELLPRLNGMFAFALWDERAGRLLLARDRLGKKPLYLALTGEGLVFGSDARAVLLVGELRPEVERKLVPEFLFQRYVGAPRTLFRGVEKLPPGSLVTYDGVDLERRTYWRLEDGEPQPVEPDELRELLREAVHRRLMSDVPLGVLLSGGVDSSAVLGLMKEAGAGQVASFTIGFGDPLYDERPLARLTAGRYGTQHHERVVDATEFVDALPRLSWYRDEPIAEPAEVPLLLLAELASGHVKVVLSGDGGDEVFGGYPKYRAERLLRGGARPAALALRAAASLLARRPSYRYLGRASETMRIRDPLLRWASWFRSFSAPELAVLLAADLREATGPGRLVEPLRRLLEPHAGLDPGRKMLVGDLLTYLPDNMLARGDKVLMAASVEGRMPLIDYELVERMARVPAAARAGLRSPKAVLRKAVADLVPTEILQAPKRGFPVPVARFLVEDPARRLERLLLSERSLDRGIYDPDRLRALVHSQGAHAERELKVFTAASLELWLRTNVDRVLPEPPTDLEVLLDGDGLTPIRATSAT